MTLFNIFRGKFFVGDDLRQILLKIVFPSDLYFWDALGANFGTHLNLRFGLIFRLCERLILWKSRRLESRIGRNLFSRLVRRLSSWLDWRLEIDTWLELILSHLLRLGKLQFFLNNLRPLFKDSPLGKLIRLSLRLRLRFLSLLCLRFICIVNLFDDLEQPLIHTRLGFFLLLLQLFHHI